MRLLEVKPSKRLGSGRLGAAEVKSSPFFKDFDWRALSLQRIKAPFIPTIRGKEDLSNFESIGKVRIEDHPVFDKSKWDAEF